jgi:lambda repressor-like predicted transcriptional regulator
VPVKELTVEEERQERLEQKIKDANEADEKRRAEAGGGGGSVKPPEPDDPLSEEGKDGDDDDFSALPAVLELIRKTLGRLVALAPVVLPGTLRSIFEKRWTDAEKILQDAIDTLQAANVSADVLAALRQAGLTGRMLQMKKTSLEYHVAQVNDAILTYPKKTWKTRFFAVAKPLYKVINSILGSFFKAIPGLDAVKEFKDHLEAGYEAGENLTEDREL